MQRNFLLVSLAVLALVACESHETSSASATAATAQPDTVPLYDDLGTYHFAISTRVPEAQQYFDQGLRLTYAFNHAEAIRAFNQAARLDPDCAICYWGMAYAYGPNINAPMDPAHAVAAYQAVQHALTSAVKASEKERALIEALARRYADPPPAERAALDSAYARAMRQVADRYPDDLDAQTLYAEALMDLRPWNYWGPDGSPHPGTEELVARLERVLAREPNHPGACHYYIHAVEAVAPEKAVPCAERLARLMPGAGHLVHMPGHIYIRVGRWADAIQANEHAVHADESYIRDQRPPVGTYVLGYYPHNYDFLAFAASMLGRSAQALQAARKVESLVPAEMLREPGTGFLQQYSTAPLRLLVRFGRWDEILQAPAPHEDLPYALAIWHYAQGMARTARGEVAAAETGLAQLRKVAQNPALTEMVVGFNTAADVLRIAANVLAGEIAARRGNHAEAVARLREAARQEDALTYGEPPDWPVPVRHHLGAVLLAAGRAADAERAYRDDLKRFPENGWSLLGLQQSLQAQGKTTEADAIRQRFGRAWSQADVQLAASRY